MNASSSGGENNARKTYRTCVWSTCLTIKWNMVGNAGPWSILLARLQPKNLDC